MNSVIDPTYRQLYRVIGRPVPRLNRQPHPDFHLTVEAQEDAVAVEAALGCLAFAPMFVGVDWGDVVEMANGRAGLARVIPGAADNDAKVAAAYTDLILKGGSDSFLLVQLLDWSDERTYSLQRLHHLANDIIKHKDGSFLYTACNWMQSKAVLIGF